VCGGGGGGGAKLAFLKSLVSIVWGPHTKNARVPHRLTRENTRVKKRYKWLRIFNPSIVQSDKLPQAKYTGGDFGEG